MAPAQSHHLLEWFSCLPMYNITYTLPIHTSYTQYQAVLADAVLKTQIWSSSFFNGLIKKIYKQEIQGQYMCCELVKELP